MARTAKVTVIIDDNGTMRLAEKSAKKLGATLDKTGKSTQSAQRGLRGTAEMSSNSTKNFAKQSQVMNGVLVPAYATLAAQIFALTAVFRFFQQAADLRVLTEGQLAYARSTGIALGSITSSLQEATQGQLAFRDAAQAASIGVAAGLTASQLQRLSTVATQASSALGRDLTDSFNRLIKGAIKAEPELLDELGIIVRLQEASENYARGLGKTANELSTFEKSQAVVNAVLEQGEDKFSKFDIKVNQVNKAGKAFNDLLVDIQMNIAPFVELLSKAVAESGKFAAAIAGFAFAAPIRSLVPDARQFEEFNRQDIGRSMVGAGLVGDRDGQLEPFLNGTFTTANLREIEKALKDTNSKIVDNSDTAHKAVRGLAIQARASILHEAGVMEKGMGGFFKRMEAQFISARGTATGAFASIRAAGTVAFTAIGGAIASAFNIIAIAGLVYTLGQLVYTYFKSADANEAFNERVRAGTEALKKQRKEIENIGKSLSDPKFSGSDGLQAVSNFLRTQEFFGSLKPGEELISREDIKSIEEATKALDEFNKRQTQSYMSDAQRGAYGVGFGMGPTIEGARLEKNARLTEEQRAAVERLNDSLETNAKHLRNSAVKDLPLVAKATEEITATQTRLAEILAMDTQTPKSLEDLREIVKQIRSGGFASLGPALKAVTEIAPIFQTAIDSSNEFYKSVTESANELSKGDIFKGLRSNLTDVIFAIQKEIDAGVNILGESTREAVSNILGFDVEIGPSMLDPKVYKKQIEGLKAGFDSFYKNQFANEKERIRLNNQINSMYMGTDVNRRQKIQLQAELKILDVSEDIRKKQLDLKTLKTTTTDSDNEQVALLQERIRGLQKSLGIITDEANFQTRLLDIEKEKKDLRIKSSRETTALKIKELGIDRSIAGHEEKMAEIKAQQASLAEEQARSELQRVKSTEETNVNYETELANAQIALGLAIAKTEQVNMQNNAMFRQLALQEDLGRIQAKNLQLEGRRLDSQLGPQDSTLGGIRSANLDAEGFRNQAESKRREAQEQNLKQFEKDNLLLEAENLEKRAQVAVYEASIQAKASQGLVNSMREGLSGVFTTAAQGGSIKTAMLQFVDSFATTLQDAVVNSLVSSFMESAQIEQAMKSFTDSLFAFISGQGGGLASLFGAGGGAIGGAGGSGGGLISSIVTGIGSLFGFRNGGIISARSGYYSQMYSSGGIAKGRDSGYPAILHGTEAVVPLPDGKKIPVQMQGSNSNVNNISVSVSVDQSGQTSTSVNNTDSTAQGRQFGEMISRAVQEELTIQSREGGLLNR